jgi:hypothetical protein
MAFVQRRGVGLSVVAPYGCETLERGWQRRSTRAVTADESATDKSELAAASVS